ncbi:MAG TPA: Clp protease N-terminal domain-containing protein [Planctomycetota bacterium]|nr:Clp protease N-terminal domain-containing protein [Planctomycetota bacterium]
MFDGFSGNAKKVMSFARQEALRLNHDYIGTEHILLGVLEAGGVATAVLNDLTVDPERIRREVAKSVEVGPSKVTMDQLPFTPRAKRVLELALGEADQPSHGYIGTEHLLLGIIGEKEGIAARVLRTLGVELDEVREKVIAFVGATDRHVVDRFTDRAKRVVGLAREEALRFNHEYVGSEHLLLGLVQEGTSVAANVLKSKAVDHDKVLREVAKTVEMGSSKVTTGELPLTPPAKTVLELSHEEASRLSHNYIGTEHLLLGLIREKGTAAQVLMKLGVPLVEVCEEVLALLSNQHEAHCVHAGARPMARKPAMTRHIPTVAGGLLGLIFMGVGLMVLLGLGPQPEPPPAGTPLAQFFAAFATTGYLTFVKVLEVLGGLLVAIPKTRGLGLLVLGPIIVNILAFHAFVARAGVFDPMVVTVCVLALYLLWVERAAFLGLLHRASPTS